MADTKISGLPASTTPLAGTEVLPIVQSGATKQVSVANLTAGRAMSASELTLTTGNLIVASGQGVDFSATPGTGTSELLADYEEGTWTPAPDGTTTFTTATGWYTKIGNVVTVGFHIVVNSAQANFFQIYGLPFAVNAIYTGHTPGGIAITDSAASLTLNGTSSVIQLYNTSGVLVRYNTYNGKFFKGGIVYRV